MAIGFNLKAGIGRIEAEFELVTPAFMGGGDQEVAELRPSAVKGALRFWWRALKWQTFLRAAHGNEFIALRNLHSTEGTLFGLAAEDEQKTGQGVLLIRVLLPVGNEVRGLTRPQQPRAGYSYLLGQGLYHFQQGYLRPTFDKARNFKLVISLKASASERYPELASDLAESLTLMGMFGGLGSRARRGSGSISLRKLTTDGEPQIIPKNPREFLARMESLFEKNKICSSQDEPPFSALSRFTQVRIIEMCGSSFEAALNMAGDHLLRFRSNGRNNRDGIRQIRLSNETITISNPDSERRFWASDHDPISLIANGARPDKLPKRIIFGLPHNYFFSSTRCKADLSPAEETRARRASPLFVHIHKFPAGHYAVVYLLLRSMFLPPGDELQYTVGGHKKNPRLIPEPDWQVITDFLDTLDTSWRFPR